MSPAQAAATTGTQEVQSQPLRRTGSKSFSEGLIHFLLLCCAGISVLTTVSIVGVLLVESAKFFRDVPLVQFFTDTQWTPTFADKHYGILPLLCGTLLITVGSGIVAIPIGLGAAIYLSEYAQDWVRQAVKPLLEVLAGIPSVVYGFFAIMFVAPIVNTIFPSANPASNALSASVVVGIMILPMVVSLSEEALRNVPQSLREGAYALGATKLDVTLRVVLPAALSGIIASFLLALSRAVGETMAVTMAAGGRPNLTLNPLEQVQTMTAFIASISHGDAPIGSVPYRALFAVAFTLFVTTISMNLLATWIVVRKREKYS